MGRRGRRRRRLEMGWDTGIGGQFLARELWVLRTSIIEELVRLLGM
jgi:hypothetical protein